MVEYSIDSETILKAKEGDNTSLENLINNNINLIYKLSQKYMEYGSGIELEDLVSQGVLGLLKALNNFDINSNVKFITYAYNYVKHEILDFKIKKNFYIRVSDKKVRKYYKEIKNNNNLSDKTMQKFEDFQYKNMISLEQSSIELYSYKDTIEGIESNIFLEDLFIKSNLTEEELFIIENFYINNYTLKEISTSLNLNLKNVKKLKQSALKKLKVTLT